MRELSMEEVEHVSGGGAFIAALALFYVGALIYYNYFYDPIRPE